MVAATNDFLPVATQGTPNVQDQADYAGSTEQEQGFADGEAPDADVFNKMLRQATFVGAALAQLMADTTNINVVDDGNQPEFLAILNQLFTPGTGGQLQLFDATHLLLAPVAGGRLWINGVNYTIPAALKLGVWGASTLNYVYAYMNAGVMTLENSATDYTLNAVNGMPQKNGDVTRTLVGMAYTDAVPNFNDRVVKRNVASYFNRLNKSIEGPLTNANTASMSFVEIDTAARTEAVVWASDNVLMQLTGSAIYGAVADIAIAICGVDGASAGYGVSAAVQAAVTQNGVGAIFGESLADGHHLFSPFGGSILGNSVGFRCGMNFNVRN